MSAVSEDAGRRSAPNDRLKSIVFRLLALSPLLLLSGCAAYLIAFTNLPQRLYVDSVRNIYFDCMEFAPEDYVYGLRPGPCRVTNVEYDTVMTADNDGFRNSRTAWPVTVAILGDSHAQGFGVGDGDTFASVLQTSYGYHARNLAMASFATERELAALARHGRDAPYVVLQYCDNDKDENDAALQLDPMVFRAAVRDGWAARVANYQAGKRLGVRKPLGDLGRMIVAGDYESRSSWRASVARRNIGREALIFRRIMERHRSLLEGKRIVLLESSGWGMNSPLFATAFGTSLSELPWLTVRVLDTSRLLSRKDYYFLDEHLNTAGHARLAAAIADQLAAWERVTP